jgi:hypothetical protein
MRILRSLRNLGGYQANGHDSRQLLTSALEGADYFSSATTTDWPHFLAQASPNRGERFPGACLEVGDLSTGRMSFASEAGEKSKVHERPQWLNGRILGPDPKRAPSKP